MIQIQRLHILPLYLLAALILLSVNTLHAQTTGTLEGRITDSEGEGIPGATVLVTGTNRGAATKADGYYIIAALAARKYEIEVLSPGKQTQSIAVIVEAGRNVTLNVQLEESELEAGEAIVVMAQRSQIITAQTTGKITELDARDLQNSTSQGSGAGIQRTTGVSGNYSIRGGRISEAAVMRSGITIPPGLEPLPTNTRQSQTQPQLQGLPQEEGPRTSLAMEPEGDGLIAELIRENGYRSTRTSPYSTFSIDVDNGSYTNIRGYLSRNQLPPADVVRIEELINYFHYDYPEPQDGRPLAFHTELVTAPWNSDHQVLRIALQGRELHPEQSPPSNLVFLIDVSGSMSGLTKLGLLKQSFLKLVDNLRPVDRVAIVVYAGAAGLVLESTPGDQKEKIRAAINRLSAGGSTAGGEGIQLAYDVALKSLMKDGNNRVILATDGDFNVGPSSQSELVQLIEEKRKDGIFLTTLGFGTGNYQDGILEQLADHGNGNYYYIDRAEESDRVLVGNLTGTLYTIAKDVKLQLRFNPSKVAAYRLIGYENRVLAARDFDNDTVDAGELGAGHQVTALYEIVPVGQDVGFELDTTQQEDYLLADQLPDLMGSNDILFARLRYKNPNDSASNLIEHIVVDRSLPLDSASSSTRFALGVAAWGMLLRSSTYRGTITFDNITEWSGSGTDGKSDRTEFVEMVKKAQSLQPSVAETERLSVAHPSTDSRSEENHDRDSLSAHTGDLTGRIVDERGEGIPGATVIVRGTSRGAASNADGYYVIQALPTQKYEIQIQSTGKTPVLAEVTIVAGQRERLDALLLKGDSDVQQWKCGFSRFHKQIVDSQTTGKMTELRAEDFR